MGTVGSTAAHRPGVVTVVAIGAGDHAAISKRRYQTDDIPIATRTGHRMKGRVGRLKFKPGIGLADLTRSDQTRPAHAITMTLKTKFVGEPAMIHGSTRDGDARNEGVWPFHGLAQRTTNHPDTIGVGGVRVVAVHTFAVPAHGEGVFRRIMNTGSKSTVVTRSFADFRSDVHRGDASVVTVQAAFLLARVAQQPLTLRSPVYLVATGAGVTRDSGIFEFFGRINHPAGDTLLTGGMGGLLPTVTIMAAQTDG